MLHRWFIYFATIPFIYDEIKEMGKDYTEADKEKDDANSSKLIELAKKEADCVGDDRINRR